MSIRVAIEHHTGYRFDRPVRVAPHVVRLRPAAHGRTPIDSFSLTITPADHFINWQQDPFGNWLARVVFPEPTTELSFTVDLVADMTVVNPFDFFIDDLASHFPFAYGAELTRDLGPYLGVAAGNPMVDDWITAFRAELADPDRTPMIDYLVAVNQRLARGIAYSIRMEPGVQAPDETLEKAIGSCRDSAWLLVEILRRMGLAARFVSGYLVQLTADVASLDGPSGTDHDFTDLHAWAEVYVPGAGWIGMDPTSGLFAGEGHIPLACTPEPSSAAPISGATDPCEVEFDFSNRVTRFSETPRVTLPYSPDQWAAIDDLGRQVDVELVTADVRLTQGGEPTFVSIDDMEAPEWTVAADGPEKRRRAAELTARLGAAFAPGHLVQHGQGKWYPGEPLPRWQMGLVWRPDGEPVWLDPALLAPLPVPGAEPTTPAGDPVDGEPLARGIAAALGVDTALVLAAYEDPLPVVLAEAGSPDPPAVAELDPEAPELADAAARLALVASFDDRRAAPAGWVVPVHWHREAGRWAGSPWRFRRGTCYLLPGDSPLGLRLPLASLPPAPAEVRALAPDRSPFEERPALAPHPGPAEPAPQPLTVPIEAAPTTALCVEVRDGVPHLFLPPVTHIEQFLDLVARVEGAVAAIGTPVVVEGYAPPSDPRVRHLLITPDPGVIEVNVHPVASWDELAAVTTRLYEEARQSRLGTETFMLDGRHAGTGGGNHITLGGATPADSPLLRRPDLLRSLVTYWQQHPALSYLFSGRFIGPTSQAPRADEGRVENLYELEIAFAQIDRLADAGEPVAPWLVDRLLRNLLIDVTGNTHRAEFCIDKLFSPDSERGRLGLLELRAFEMPPHPQMALVQSLLLRALVARFWRAPHRGDLVRWGTALHDRFLLPHFAAADIAEVADDLAAHGLPFERSWLDPFLEFRFPQLGAVQVGDVGLELRMAIEPWMVLGEESGGNATARYVDSSVERLQVKATGLRPERHVVTCNGVPVPLHPTARVDEHVAGVRYRAWQPPSALHPLIGVDSPLVFDLVDLWTGHSLGGCTYHVAHPGGRNYDTFPVNANEAEARRGARFWAHGHTPGPVDAATLSAAPRDREYPLTLDLRRHASAIES